MRIKCPNCGETQNYGAEGKVTCRCCGISFRPPRGGEAARPASESTRAYPAVEGEDKYHRLSLKKKWSPLAEWLAYFAVLAVVIAVTVRGKLEEAVQADATGLTLFIVLLFGLALAKSGYDVLYIDREFALTQRQIRELWEGSKIGVFLQGAAPSIFRDHVENLFNIFRNDQEITQDNLIEILHARLNSRTKVVDLSAGILTTLGLIGTIIGMVMAVDGISAVTEAVGGDGGLLAKMSETLGGMGTAFYTTLMGAVLGGIFLRVLTASVQASQDYLVAHIAELSEVHIIPKLRKHARDREKLKDKEVEDA